MKKPIRPLTQGRQETILAWGTLAVAAAGLILGLYNYGTSRENSRRTRQLRENELLNTAWDLLGGGKGTEDIVFVATDPEKLEEARRILEEQVLVVNPASDSAYRHLSVYWLAKGSMDKAVEAAQRSVELDSQSVDNRTNLGYALMERGDLSTAIAVLQEASRMDPRDEVAINNLGTALFKTGEFLAASEAFRRTIRLDPFDPTGHVNLGVALRELGESEGSLKACQEAVRLNTAVAPAHYCVGMAFESLGKLEDAEFSFLSTLRLVPDHEKARSGLSRVVAALATQPELPKEGTGEG